MVRGITLAVVLVTLIAGGAHAREVCRTVIKSVPYPGYVAQVPVQVCEEVPDAPPRAPTADLAERARVLREQCELWKTAYGEEKGQELCQLLLETLAKCDGWEREHGEQAGRAMCKSYLDLLPATGK